MVTALAVSGNIFADLSNSNDCLTSSQLFFSQAIQNFSTEATSCSSLFGIVCGQLIAPFVRLQSIGCFSSLLGNGQQARFFTHYFSLGLSLGAEGAGMHLGTQLIRTGRIEENSFGGSLHSTLTILACKMTSKVVPPNLVMLHLAQDGAMVGLNEGLAKIGIGETEPGTVLEKLAHAEITAIQLQCSAIFVSVAAPQISMIHARCELNFKVQKTEARYQNKENVIPAKSGLSLTKLSSTDLLLAGSMMLAGCQSEGASETFLTLGLLIKGGITLYQSRKTNKSKASNRSAPESEEIRPETHFFGTAIYQFADFLNREGIREITRDPYLVRALHAGKREKMIRLVESLIPEPKLTSLRSSLVEDMLKTALLLSRDPSEFSTVLSTLLKQKTEIKKRFDQLYPPIEEEVRDFPSSLSGSFTRILMEILQEKTPASMVSVEIDRRFSESSLSSSVDPLADTPPSLPLPSQHSIGSQETRLIRTTPSSFTPTTSRSFLPQDGSASIYIIVLGERDFEAHEEPLLNALSKTSPLNSIKRSRGMPAPILITTTSLAVDDLIRIEEPSGNGLVPVVETLNLTGTVSDRLRMEASYVSSSERKSVRIRRKIMGPYQELLGEIVTTFLDKNSLSPPPKKLPDVDYLMASIPITEEFMEDHQQSIYFQGGGNLRLFLQSVGYELICNQYPHLNTHLSHQTEFFWGGHPVQVGDVLNFYIFNLEKKDSGVSYNMLVYNQANQWLFQMRSTGQLPSSNPSSESLEQSSRSTLPTDSSETLPE